MIVLEIMFSNVKLREYNSSTNLRMNVAVLLEYSIILNNLKFKKIPIEYCLCCILMYKCKAISGLKLK